METRAALLAIPAAALSDVQMGLTTMSAEIRCYVAGSKLAGPALTVQCHPGSILTVHQALFAGRSGDVLVVDGQGDLSSALFGELMARDARVAGLAGVVIDGAVRDIEGLRALGLPVYARGVTPRVGSNRLLGRVGVRIACGGVCVTPGDWIVADDDGVVVVPEAEVSRVAAAGLAVEAKEHEIAARLDAGDRIADILGLRALFDSEAISA